MLLTVNKMTLNFGGCKILVFPKMNYEFMVDDI